MMNELTINTVETNPVFSNFSINSKGEYAEMEATMPSGSRETKLHVHPLQTVQLEAIDGDLGIILPDRRLIIAPGLPYEIPKNTEHAFYNADEKPVRFKTIVKPALHIEWMAKEMIASTKRKQSKLMSWIEYSYILNQIKGEYYRSGIPIFLQKIIHPFLAFFGKILGVDKRIRQVT
ncbi:MAG: hypothetical protein QM737_13660 [Ferruginibacter sp.]